jgi:hypothetical protein
MMVYQEFEEHTLLFPMITGITKDLSEQFVIGPQ